MAGTWHLLGTQAIDIGEDSATVETYSTVWYRTVSTERTVDLIKGLRYLDTLVRKGGRWLIQRQVITEDWGRTDEVVRSDEGWLIGRQVMVHDWRRSDPVPGG